MPCATAFTKDPWVMLMFAQAVFWYFLIFDNPEKHPRIAAEEKERLVNSLKVSLTFLFICDFSQKPLISWNSKLNEENQ